MRTAPSRVLLLDYDGTLAPFRIARDEAVPYPGVREVLDAIVRDGRSRVVVVSGRRPRELLPLLGLERTPEVWGSHGLERLHADGRHEVAPLPPAAERGLRAARTRAAEAGFAGSCEEKPGCLALHWRGVPETARQRMREFAARTWAPLADASELELHEFDGGAELRAGVRDKGDAVRTVVDEAGAEAAVAYLGDDRTDEDAFRALRGRGWGVLVRPEFRATAADLWIRPPEELLAFLRRWRRECRAADG